MRLILWQMEMILILIENSKLRFGLFLKGVVGQGLTYSFSKKKFVNGDFHLITITVSRY